MEYQVSFMILLLKMYYQTYSKKMATMFFIPFLPITMSIDVGTLGYAFIKKKISGIKNKLPVLNADSLDELLLNTPVKEITVVINAHGESDTLEKSIRDVFNQSYPIKNVYISDSDIDDSKEVIEGLKSEFFNLNYWSKERVVAKADKINHLVRDPNVDLGDFVYLKDSNAKMQPGLLENLVAGFEDDNVAAMTSFGFVTPPDDNLANYFHYGKEWINRLGKFRKNAQQIRRAMYVVCGASFMVRSDILKDIPIPLGTQTEDTAYTWELHEQGYKVGAAQNAEVIAEDVSTLRAQLKQSFRWYTGSWQNLWLHKKALYGPKSKGKALAYSTILPGFIESTLYTATVVSLPALYAISPDIGNGFLIGDTALSLASPLISMPLNGEARKAPREFLNTLTHYHQITAFKVLASSLWIGSGAKVAYDIISGKSKNWSGTWTSLK